MFEVSTDVAAAQSVSRHALLRLMSRGKNYVM
jgi:hypothetical protein